jgi:hypothetical protein
MVVALEHPRWCSVCDLHNRFGSKYAGFGSQQNGFGPAFLHSLLEAGKRHSKAQYLPEKSVVNTYQLCCSLFLIGQIIMIGPGGLLVVVSLPPICNPNFSFMHQVGKNLKNY